MIFLLNRYHMISGHIGIRFAKHILRRDITIPIIIILGIVINRMSYNTLKIQ